MDVLVPGVGELIGGSQREERLDVRVEPYCMPASLCLSDSALALETTPGKPL